MPLPNKRPIHRSRGRSFFSIEGRPHTIQPPRLAPFSSEHSIDDSGLFLVPFILHARYCAARRPS